MSDKGKSIYINIQDDILNQVYQPGEKLQISKLRERYNTSVAPIREALVSACHNRYLMGIRKQLELKMRWLVKLAFNYFSEDLAGNFQEHKAIADAAIDRDIDKAIDLAIQHLGMPEQHLIPALKAGKIL